ncbi:CDP-alcohol phosphatidyltransferase family protein [Actinomadura scrupuli]|uniref:CDP-alcohol phosphatidyltransferase family protein n=1 Tax=Actinomadura scrupuli TaxID=559629 RepID=UPI003D9903DC
MTVETDTTRTAPRGFGQALRSLSSAQKTAKGAPAYSRFVNRKLGRVLAALAYTMGLTPNQVTAISALFSFAGIALLALVPPSPLTGVGVSLALILGYALDSADGQLARLRGGGSKSGEWLDHIIDCAKISLLHSAMLIACYRFFDLAEPAYLLVPIGFCVVAAVMFFGMILNDQLRRVHQATTGAGPQEPARPSTIRSLMVMPTDYGVLCLAFLLLGSPELFFVLYVLLFAGNLLFLAAALVKWFRDMSALDTPPAARRQEHDLVPQQS